MDNEKIKELAREYSEDVFGNGDYPFKEDDMCNAEDDFESVVTFLSKTHCIVEKSKVKEKYALCKMGYTECEGLELGYVMDALEDIFGKDDLIG